MKLTRIYKTLSMQEVLLLKEYIFLNQIIVLENIKSFNYNK
jgi:hypothetical protein